MITCFLCFFRRAGVDGEGMHTGAHFFGENFVNASLPCDPAQSLECARDDVHAKMRLAPGSGARMACVSRTFVLYQEFYRRKGCGEFPAHIVGDGHACLSMSRRDVKRFVFLFFHIPVP